MRIALQVKNGSLIKQVLSYCKMCYSYYVKLHVTFYNENKVEKRVSNIIKKHKERKKKRDKGENVEITKLYSRNNKMLMMIERKSNISD